MIDTSKIPTTNPYHRLFTEVDPGMAACGVHEPRVTPDLVLEGLHIPRGLGEAILKTLLGVASLKEQAVAVGAVLTATHQELVEIRSIRALLDTVNKSMDCPPPEPITEEEWNSPEFDRFREALRSVRTQPRGASF